MTGTEPTVWLNGNWVPITQAALPLHDTGFVHGDAVTEMLRTFGHKPFRVEDHLARLAHSLRVVHLSTRYRDAELAQAIVECVKHNEKAIPPQRDLGIIIFVTGGPNLTYLGHHSGIDFRPTVGIHTFPLHCELWRDKYQHGVHLVVADRPGIAAEALDPTAKVRSRIHWRIADREVREQFPDAQAILLDACGTLTETSSGNLFVVRNRTVFTPRDTKVLNGISRQVTIELADRLGMIVREADITPEEASEAEEMWVSSTPSCLLPVTRFNNRPVGDGKPGERYRQLLDQWSELAGLSIADQE